MTRTKSIALLTLVVIVAAAAGMLLSRALLPSAAERDSPALAAGTLLEPARPLPEFQLTDHRGNDFGKDQLRGQWSFVFFGFTNCPDVCPMTLRLLSQITQSVADLQPDRRPNVILVSVDPKRDSPAQLAKYVAFFDASFTGLTGEQGAIDSFTRQLGVPVAITPSDDGGYTVDHSAAVFLVDPTGALRALFSPPHSPDLIAEDYRRVVDE